jgi:DNA-binding GntR family transcriptional regulator
VAQYIRRLIFEGKLAHGDHVRQDEIAAELGVSRIPVREALIALDREGYITLEAHRGAFVQGIDETAVLDHYELIGLLYGLVARRVTERADDAGLEALGKIQRSAAAAKTAEEFYEYNDLFLRQMFTLAGSPRLKSVSRLMSNIVPGNFFETVPNAWQTQKRGLTAVAKAVRARDGETAAARFSEMMRAHGKAVAALLLKQRAEAAAGS